MDQSRPSTRGRWWLWVALFLALLYSGWRGVWRAGQASYDLTVGYAAAKAWVGGLDPYSAEALKGELIRAGAGELASSGMMDGVMRHVNFPASIPLFLPLALGTWPLAKFMLLGLNVAGVVFIAGGLARVMGWPRTSLRSIGLLACLLALAPVHTAMAAGQTSILSLAALVAAMLSEARGRPLWAGVLYGLATAIKVQIGLPFLAWVLWRRRWGSGVAAMLVLAGLAAASVGRMQWAGVPWWRSWSANLALMSGEGGFNDWSAGNAARLSLVNLQYGLQVLMSDRGLINGITLAAVALAALAVVWWTSGRERVQGRDMLATAIIAMLCLLVAYHRTYDAVLLALPMAWAIGSLGSAGRYRGLAVLLLCLDFLLPGQVMLATAAGQGRLPSWLTGNVLGASIVWAQHVWVIVLLTLVLLSALAREKNVAAS